MSSTLRAIARELPTLISNPPDGVRVRVRDGGRDLVGGGVEGIVQGAAGTPYAGGYFRVRFDFADTDFPNAPPKCTMITKIFHPNISKTGEICVDTLKKGWKREYGIGHVLVTIKCLLIYPGPDSALDEEAGKLLLENYDEYHKMAALMTSIHATPKIPPPEFADATSTSSTVSSPNNSTRQPLSSADASLPNQSLSSGSTACAITTDAKVKMVAVEGAAAAAASGSAPVAKVSTAPKAKRGLKRL